MTYAHAVVPATRREHVPQAQSEMGIEVLLQWLEAAGQPVPPTASFLQDNLAVIVMEGLLDQIELMQRQCIAALEQIDRAAKHKLPTYEGLSRKLKQVKPLSPWMADTVVPSVASSSLFMLAWPTAASTAPSLVGTSVAKAQEAPLDELLLEQQDKKMDEVPLTREKLALLDAIDPSWQDGQGLAVLSHAPDALGPTKSHFGCKLFLDASKLEYVKFLANILERAEPCQMLFIKAILILAPLVQVTVVMLTTDPCTPAQYDGLTATLAANKGKRHAVL
ncbi:hypothetical protein C0992_007673 [Termitomyces sp. T32_za158]|nr:hypothetical protein C0992_007673 [Termitomyces sp. T32_za158]